MLEQPGWERALLGSITNLVAVVKGGIILYINPAGNNMLGAEEDDKQAFVGQKFTNFIHADYTALIDIGLKIFAEEKAPTPLKLMQQSGRVVDVSMRVCLLSPDSGDDTFMVECRDITNYIQASEDARRREQRLAGVLAAVADAIITIDQKGIIQTLNLATSRIFGYEADEMMGKSINMLMPAEYRDSHDDYLQKYAEHHISSAIGNTREMVGQHKDGHPFPIEVTVTELHEGGQRFYTGVLRDITQRKKDQERIQYLAHHDALTGLPNRNLYRERTERAIARAARSGKPFAFMFIDLDNFKPVNDALGHEVGDVVLKVVAHHLTDCVRTSDTVARVGGDEFVAILESLENPENASIVAQKIIDALATPIDVSTTENPDTTVQIGASIGISIFPQDGKTLDQLNHAADTAMYQVKKAGRNHYQFYTKTESD